MLRRPTLDRTKDAIRIQRQYYTDTATEYDSMHGNEGSLELDSFKYVQTLLRLAEARSILDVGAGTGRAIVRMREAMPDVTFRGIEPVAALIEQASEKNGIPHGEIVQGVGEALPFEDKSFDVVCSFSILHHVARPNHVVREMLRVARKAVLICDGNRFGQGTKPVRLLKLALSRLGIWGIVNFVKTGGKGYMITEGDGLAYSYSLYDSFDILASWADQLIFMPSQPTKANSWLHPLITSHGLLALALKDPKAVVGTDS